MRPKSIAQFEAAYLAVIILGIVNLALSWSALNMRPDVQQVTAQLGANVLPIAAGILIAIQFALWFFAARRASNVARWIVAVLTAYAVVDGVWALATFGVDLSLGTVIGFLLLALQVVVLWLLFRPESAAWFRGDPA